MEESLLKPSFKKDVFCAGFSWGARQESARECAERVLRLMKGLKKLAPILAKVNWSNRRRGDLVLSKKLDEIEAFLKTGVNRDDFERKPIEELGFLKMSYFSDERFAISLNIHCGVYSPRSGNSIISTFPRNYHLESDLLSYKKAMGWIKVVEDAFEPDDGAFAPFAFDEVYEANSSLYLGWLTYVAKTNPVYELLKTYAFEETAKGMVIRVGEECTDCCSEESIKKLNEISRVLGGEAGFVERKEILPRR